LKAKIKTTVMRILFLFILAAVMASGCDSNTLSQKGEKKDKGERLDEDDVEGENDRTRKKSNWTKKDRNKWMDECESELGAKKDICPCVMAKVEKKYPDPVDAEDATEAEGIRWAKECLTGGNSDDNVDDYGTDDRDDRDGGDERITDDEDNNSGDRWTSQQRQSYIQGCAGSAVQAGLTRTQANSYCACMVGKLEKKVNFQVASRMTEADFQSQEWQEAAMECRPNR
jgi:hypothetical protein